MTLLRIEWAYPSSPHAEQFAPNGAGCYVLYVLPADGRPGKAIAGHLDLSVVARAGDLTGLPYAVLQASHVKRALIAAVQS